MRVACQAIFYKKSKQDQSTMQLLKSGGYWFSCLLFFFLFSSSAVPVKAVYSSPPPVEKKKPKKKSAKQKKHRKRLYCLKKQQEKLPTKKSYVAAFILGLVLQLQAGGSFLFCFAAAVALSFGGQVLLGAYYIFPILLILLNIALIAWSILLLNQAEKLATKKRKWQFFAIAALICAIFAILMGVMMLVLLSLV